MYRARTPFFLPRPETGYIFKKYTIGTSTKIDFYLSGSGFYTSETLEKVYLDEGGELKRLGDPV